MADEPVGTPPLLDGVLSAGNGVLSAGEADGADYCRDGRMAEAPYMIQAPWRFGAPESSHSAVAVRRAQYYFRGNRDTMDALLARSWKADRPGGCYCPFLGDASKHGTGP